MAKNRVEDRAKAKAAKQKKLAIGLGVLLVFVLVYEVPKTMKMLSKHPNPPVASAPTTTPTTPAPGATTAPSSLAAPTLAGAAPTTTTSTTSDLVSAVPVSADPGQLLQFERFASKDPFAAQVTTGAKAGGAKTGSSTGGTAPKSGSGSSGAPPKTPPPPPTPPPTAAVIKLDGVPLQVSSGADFPTSGPIFDRLGSPLFHLASLTQTTATVTIVGGSYASGANALTLTVGKLVTLQNTADGTRYTLLLEPQGTAVPGAAQPGSTTTTAPASTTPSVVPSASGG